MDEGGSVGFNNNKEIQIKEVLWDIDIDMFHICQRLHCKFLPEQKPNKQARK